LRAGRRWHGPPQRRPDDPRPSGVRPRTRLCRRIEQSVGARTAARNHASRLPNGRLPQGFGRSRTQRSSTDGAPRAATAGPSWGDSYGCAVDASPDGEAQDRARGHESNFVHGKGVGVVVACGTRLAVVEDAPLHPTRDLDHLPGHVTADLVRRERHHGARHVLGPAQLAQRHRASHAPL
jgi:hypothetical protein